MNSNPTIYILQYLNEFWGDGKFYDIENLLKEFDSFKVSKEYKNIISDLKREKLILTENGQNLLGEIRTFNDLRPFTYLPLKGRITITGVEFLKTSPVIKQKEDGIRLKNALESGDMESFFQIIKSVFASIPYTIYKEKEGYFQSNIHVILKMLDFNVLSEFTTNNGRIDAVIELKEKIYICEFKLENSRAAIDQIRDRKYHEPFLLSSKEIILVGVAFSVDERNIKDWIYEKY